MSCPCILQSGKRAGQKCGINARENGRCGRHQKVCAQRATPIKAKKVVVQSSCRACGRAIKAGVRSRLLQVE